ncbi:PilZ domain-containing protein [Stutzerimonas xanthomarina]|jgi:hypothetical protein|uniref:PilZ domain-containing protein n=2 Tax=Stutzerimonas TaxID=2901164 RepID=A0AA40RWE6_STUST|nr:PilZ domain-containing protein [Stutzerimonas stutzeri]MBK3919814.1 PilZ domain-containing protein [Stutzerimonas frequens]RRV04699.1 PilZ domain-containing protein [Stutzerimonas xanthomarina]
MNASNRRHTRYTVPEGALADQKLRPQGMLSGLRGWTDCRVRDMSIAGALVLAKKSLGSGSAVSIKLILRTGEELIYHGTVVNVSDGGRGEYRLGVSLGDVQPGTHEHTFLHDLASVFPPAL